MLPHPTLDNAFQLVKKRSKLACKEPVRAERDTKIPEREGTLFEPIVLKNNSLQVLSNTTKVNWALAHIRTQPKRLPKNLQLL